MPGVDGNISDKESFSPDPISPSPSNPISPSPSDLKSYDTLPSENETGKPNPVQPEEVDRHNRTWKEMINSWKSFLRSGTNKNIVHKLKPSTDPQQPSGDRNQESLSSKHCAAQKRPGSPSPIVYHPYAAISPLNTPHRQ